MNNFKSKVPDHPWPEVKAHLTTLRDMPTREGEEADACDVWSPFGKDCPSQCAVLSEDLEILLTLRACPGAIEKHIRTTNLIERRFEEERRGTKTIPRFFKEKSCLKLVHATLIRVAGTWQRVGITAKERAQLNLLYQELKIEPATQ